ncbi:MAG: ABC transporter permease [Actinomycetota bacterium]|nr:ABC transporter permease [Actinomycetota bacterium]
MSQADLQVRTNDPPRLRPLRRMRELWRQREVMANLARKELKVRYKSSVLGVAWSMLNPLLYLLVFYVVFTFFLPSQIPNFPVYLLSGLLPWTLFSSSLGATTQSVVGGGNLVTKVAFPHEMLPLAAVRAQTVNFFFQFLVLVGFLVVFGQPLLHRGVVLLPLALGVLLLFVMALGFATSAWNVRYRDTGHLVELATLAWFWSTPIVYPVTTVTEGARFGPVADAIYLLNPLTNIVLTFQRAIYGGATPEALRDRPIPGPDPGVLPPVLPMPGLRWYAFRLLILGAVSLIIFLLTWRLFYKRSGDFAEEL